MKFTPFWKLYGKSEKGFVLFEVYGSKFDYMAGYDFWLFSITICSNKITFPKLKVKKTEPVFNPNK